MQTLSKGKKKFILCSLAIPLVLLCIFVIYPLISLGNISFTNFDGLNNSYDYIGWANFKKIFIDSPYLWSSLTNNLKYFVVSLIFIPVELALSAMFVTKFRGVRFFKSVVLLPYVINGVAVASTFAYFLSPINGGLNTLLETIGLGGWVHGWLSDETIVSYTLPIINVWKWSGYHIILFIAALQSIDHDMIEAATVDGANSFQIFRRIQLPSIRMVIDFIFFTNVAGSFKMFDLPWVMTGGGPGYASSTFTLYTINTAFTYRNFGLAAAMAIVMIIMVAIIYLLEQLVLKLLRRG